MDNFILFMKDFFSKGLIAPHLTEANSTLKMVITVLCYLAVIILPYLLGSLNFAIIISGKQYRQDIRNFGSKNAGMTNMMRTYGKKAAGLTLLGDALKAVVSCLLGYALLGQLGAYIAGLFCIIGHMFPIYYRFKGGKGVVTAAITVLMCNPFVFLILFLLFVVIVLFTKYISLGSVVCMLLYPLVLNAIDSWILEIPVSPYVWCAVLMTALVVVKHWENIKRLREGKESKFSFKKSVKAPSEEQNDEVAK